MIKRIIKWAAILFPTTVFAQSSSLSLSSLTPSSGDITVQMLLAPLFGGLVGGSGGNDPLIGLIGQFNAMVLLVGAVYLAYTFVAGTVQSAHDGSMLGQKWSSVWVPIRTAAGVAMIVPISSGYAVIQSLVMTMVLQGIGGADMLWSLYNSQSATTLPQVAAQTNNTLANELAKSVLKQQLCLTVFNGEVQASGSNVYKPISSIPILQAQDSTNAPVPTDQNTSCGYVIMPIKNSIDANANGQNNALSSWFGKTFSPVNFQATMSSAHQAAFSSLQSSMASIAQVIYQQIQNSSDQPTGSATDSNQSLATKFGQAVDTYNQAISTAATSALSSQDMTNNIASNASSQGWGVAGAYYMKYTYVQAALNQAMSGYPIPHPRSSMKINDAEFGEKITLAESNMKSILDAAGYTNENGLKQQAQADEYPEADSTTSKLMHLIAKFNPASAAQILITANKNPILAASDFGDSAVKIGIAGEIAVAAAAAITPNEAKVFGTGGSVGGSTAAAIVLLPILTVIVGSLVGFGGMVAYYLPMVPFLLWFGLVVGWYLLVIEAIIGAPLWAVAHLHPDGDGMTGRGGQGYGLLLGLILRPPLAIMGLCVAMLAMVPVGTFFNQTFWSAFTISQDGSAGFISGTAGVVIYSVSLIAIVHKVFGFGLTITDDILRWMGGDQSRLGGHAQEVSRAGEGAGALVGGIAGKGIGGALQQGQSNLEKANHRIKDNESRESAAKNDMVSKTMKRAEVDEKRGDHMGQAHQEAQEKTAKWLTEQDGDADSRTVNAKFDQYMEESFDSLSGESGSYKKRQEFKSAMETFGMVPTAADYNKFMHLSKGNVGPSPTEHAQEIANIRGVGGKSPLANMTPSNLNPTDPQNPSLIKGDDTKPKVD